MATTRRARGVGDVVTPDCSVLTHHDAAVPGREDVLIPEREFLGIPFAVIDPAGVARLLAARSAGEPFAYLATPSAQHVVLLHRGIVELAFGLSRAWFLTNDSRVLRGLGRALFSCDLPLVTGSDLTVQLLRQVIGADDPVTVIGGSEELRRDLQEQYGLTRVALYSPPFGFSRDPEQLARCIAFVREHPARFVFIACGAPQSEVLAAHIVEAGGCTGIGLCIGASLLFATGRLRRAPLVWQRLCLEWLFRLTQEPRRLARRLWHAQLPVMAIAADAWLRPGRARRGFAGLRRPPSPSGLPRPAEFGCVAGAAGEHARDGAWIKAAKGA